MTMAQLLRVTKGQPYRLIPRHGITQSSGKQRVIDDAARGGQSERSQDANKLVLCTPFRPAQHVALVAHFTPEAEWTAQANDHPARSWRRLAGRIPAESNFAERSAGLCSVLLAPPVEHTSGPNLQLLALWTPAGRHKLQPLFQVGRSNGQTIPSSIRQHVL